MIRRKLHFINKLAEIVLFGCLFYFISRYVLIAQTNKSGQYFLGSGGYGRITDVDFHDLDYNKDFSLEAVIHIKKTEAHNQYNGILSKTANNGMYSVASAGWGICLRNTASGGYFLAKVGDGINQAQGATEKYYTDRTHLIMTWDKDTKTMTLYVNGEQALQQTRPSIDLEKIDTNDEFWMGKSLAVLQSPIIYARLWNRDLTPDIATLYNHYNTTRQHELPDNINTADLKSEWLMFEESDSLGAEGTSHVKDTIGSNNIEMLNGATIVFNLGVLSAISPANGASGQDKALTLTASGGYADLITKGSVKGPVQYFFQIDEKSEFDSPALEESGWITEFSTWQAVLAPEKTYYWRVRVKDSANSPLESPYTGTNSFTTQKATTWYVRPAGGSYGAANGTDYANAWNGLSSIVWGENGVEAGDTLYICGSHINTYNGGYAIDQGNFIPDASGTPDSPLIISGACPNDPGIIWGAWIDGRSGGMVPNNWEEISSGIFHNISASAYNKSYDNYGLYENINGENYDKYTKLKSSEAVFQSSERGVYYII